ncbi:glycogen debranching protein GlgX [Acidisoma cladoniae]|uniref:glycogen debranching protein GlgX n=1 Tax=Acidisoma cladoniae TaxID=3040935 RepID=UPI00254F6B0D|nr:glycogen debranching protein GlgX [Acidisoma sp. PAMC 29798]
MTDEPASAGRPEPLGVSLDGDGINVAVFSANATAIEICLFDETGDVEIGRVLLPGRTHDIFHGHVAGVKAGARYGLRASGPWAPEAGHRFNHSKLLIDPYTTLLDRPFTLHPSMFDWPPGTAAYAPPNQTDSAPHMPKGIVEPPYIVAPPAPMAGLDGAVVYEMHVRGFSKLCDAVPEAKRGTFAALAEPALLTYVRDLGVGTVEVMPAAAWLDERHLPPLGLTNYWGYNPVAYCAPDPRLAPGGFAEIRATTDAWRATGIAAVLDVVYNHTGEGDIMGPTVSLRGLDHATYYRHDPRNPAVMVNDTGCGNTLAAERPIVLRLIMDSLRLWALRGGFSGFRFDLAAAVARLPNGFVPAAPFLQAISQDPTLRDLTMIAEPWDIGPGGYQLGHFPPPWGEWNDRFRDTMRRFWRGDAGLIGEVATRFAGSSDIFGTGAHQPSRSINFVTAHDGFPLADLVSYASKHNEGNGEHGRDGSEDNYSWNHGVEGPSHAPGVLAGRQGDVRALLTTLLLSRGTPMLAAGDELGRSQGGNNNAYAQDTPVSWLDWSARDTGLEAFTTRLIAARRACPVLTDLFHLTGAAVDGTLRPDVTWRRPDAAVMAVSDWTNPENRTLIADLYRPADGLSPESRALVVLHAGWARFTLTLPEVRVGRHWRRVIDSANPTGDTAAVDDTIDVQARAALLFIEEAAPIAKARTSAPPTNTSAKLARLAEAAGLTHDWWDITGTNHLVSDDSKRALLAAMQLPAGTAGDIEESLHKLSVQTVLAPLPPSLVVVEAQPISLPLGPALGRMTRPIVLSILREDGSRDRLVVTPETGDFAVVTAPDGRTATVRRVVLPPQPRGRHLITCEDRGAVYRCQLIIAPARCYLPPELMAGDRRFGLAAHLYTLRRAGDQGIGDFTTLAQVGAATAAKGGAIIGLNPLHALFPEDRKYTSPYSPSDRRFLDPIYVDVTALPYLGDLPQVRAALATEEAAFTAARATAAVDYPAVWAAKRRVLSAAAQAMTALPPHHPARLALAAFELDKGEALASFANFEAISAAYPHGSWRDFPEDLRKPDGAAVAGFAARESRAVHLSSFMQWVADQQLAAAAGSTRRAGLGLGFYRDLAVGTAPHGAEAWAEQDLLMTGVSVGAPPDPFSMEGQNWSLPPPNPLAMAAEGFAGFAGLLRANMRHAGALRIDHVLALNRLFLIPEGGRATDGAYLAYPLQDMLGITTLESRAAQCIVVGEDLGTVPDGVREALAARALLSYRVLWFERRGDRFLPPSAYPNLAAACVSTHDLPTLAGWWLGADIAERVTLGLSTEAGAVAARMERRMEKGHLLAALAEGGFATGHDVDAPLDAALVAAVHAYVAATPCMLDLVQADDLAGETAAVNLPGTDKERPNWRRKIAIEAEGLWATDAGVAILRAVQNRAQDTAIATG